MKIRAGRLKVWLKFIPHRLAILVLLVVLIPAISGTQNRSAAAHEGREIVHSRELLEGTKLGVEARYVYGDVRAAASLPEGNNVYQELFRIDPSVVDSIAPASELESIGIERVGQTSCTLADGTLGECAFGYGRIEFMGAMKEGRVIFGPEDAQPTLGLSALQAIGFMVEAETQTLKHVSETDASP